MELKTIKDLIAASGFRRTFIYNQIKQGKLAPPLKIGISSRWKPEDVEKWLNTLLDSSSRKSNTETKQGE